MTKYSELLSALEVEGHKFSASLKPPGSTKTFFLGGAGVRGMQIQDNFIKFTAIGVYLEEEQAVPTLAAKWSGKTGDELTVSAEFFRDVVTGPFEKFTMITCILPLTGQQYSAKVIENCVAHWKAIGIYTEAEEKAAEKFLDVFKDETFLPGSSILFTQSPLGTLTIAFSKDGTIPEEGVAVIENKPLSGAVLYSIIGENGVSPSARKSLASRVSELLKVKENGETAKA